MAESGEEHIITLLLFLKTMRLLVVGANGLLGSNIVSTGLRRNWAVAGTYHTTKPHFDVALRKFDLLDPDGFDNLLRWFEPRVVVNCAAMTDVDYCERHPRQAVEINAMAPGVMARQCDDAGIQFVHVSTDYVFDGEQREPYLESDTMNPLQEYGRTKSTGEALVKARASSSIIPRVSFLWGFHRNSGQLEGFPAWVVSRIQSGQPVPLFTDQWISPSRAGSVAGAILDLIERGTTGTFHIASSSCVTPMEFGQRLVTRIGESLDCLVESQIDDVARKAARPAFTCLDVTKIVDVLERPQPTLIEDLESVSDAI